MYNAAAIVSLFLMSIAVMGQPSTESMASNAMFSDSDVMNNAVVEIFNYDESVVEELEENLRIKLHVDHIPVAVSQHMNRDFMRGFKLLKVNIIDPKDQTRESFYELIVKSKNKTAAMYIYGDGTLIHQLVH